MKANDTQSEKLMVRNALKQKCVFVSWIPLLLFAKDYKCGQKLMLNIVFMQFKEVGPEHCADWCAD